MDRPHVSPPASNIKQNESSEHWREHANSDAYGIVGTLRIASTYCANEATQYLDENEAQEQAEKAEEELEPAHWNPPTEPFTSISCVRNGSTIEAPLMGATFPSGPRFLCHFFDIPPRTVRASQGSQ